jgi:hypothetical protein
MKRINILKTMGLIVAAALVFAACNQITGGEAGAEGYSQPAASTRSLGAKQVGVNPAVWTISSNAPFANMGVSTINGVASNSGRIAYTNTISSTAAWTGVTTTPFGSNDFINVMVYGNGTFVAVGGPGTQGKAARSTDGKGWTGVANFPIGKGVDVYALAYGNGYFVAGDDAGYIAYSSNGGQSWNAVKVFTGGQPINALTYDSKSDRFIAVGGTTTPMVV